MGDEFKDGLLHISCIASERIDRVEECLQDGAKVWVKVSDVKEEEGKYGLDMRYVSQNDGKDLDPYHAKGPIPDNFSGFGSRRNSGRIAERLSSQLDVQEVLSSRKQARLESEGLDASDESNSSEARKLRKKVRKKLKKAAKKLEKARKKAEKAKK